MSIHVIQKLSWWAGPNILKSMLNSPLSETPPGYLLVFLGWFLLTNHSIGDVMIVGISIQTIKDKGASSLAPIRQGTYM